MKNQSKELKEHEHRPKKPREKYQWYHDMVIKVLGEKGRVESSRNICK